MPDSPFISAYDIYYGIGREEEIEKTISRIYRAELEFLEDIRNECFSQIVYDELQHLSASLNEVERDLFRTLPALLTTKEGEVFSPYGMEFISREHGSIMKIPLVTWMIESDFYLRPAGLNEISYESMLSEVSEDVDVVFHFKKLDDGTERSLSITLSEISEHDAALVKDFVNLFFRYAAVVRETGEEHELIKRKLEALYSESAKIYASPNFYFSIENDKLKGVLIPSGGSGINLKRIDVTELKRTYLSLRAESFEKSIIMDDWRWRPWYEYCLMKENEIRIKIK